jgi:hypothetical protein
MPSKRSSSIAALVAAAPAARRGAKARLLSVCLVETPAFRLFLAQISFCHAVTVTLSRPLLRKGPSPPLPANYSSSWVGRKKKEKKGGKKGRKGGDFVYFLTRTTKRKVRHDAPASSTSDAQLSRAKDAHIYMHVYIFKPEHMLMHT